jgi:adenylosuccinate lyase
MERIGPAPLSFDTISPIDGRYRSEAEALASYFSERALTRERFRVELAYLGLLVKLGVAPHVKVPRVVLNMEEVKRLEDELGHDVKAVEVSLRRSMRRLGAAQLSPYVHLGLTSEDTNSLAYALLLKSALEKVLVPSYSLLAKDLAELARKEASTVMVARTHGRPAIPTTFGKEMAVFAVRIAERVSALGKLRPMAKFSGAVGTYASFSLLGPRKWPEELAQFVTGLGIAPATYSTQVVPGERLSDILHHVININQLVLSLSRDLWLYQTLDLVRFVRPGKVSSSTMPQKVNPVDLENAEGQVEVSNSLLMLLAYRLQVTRLQRDLSDSVVRRMLGQALAHSLIANLRIRSSLSSMRVERSVMSRDLKEHPEVYAEREQVSLRLKGDERGYEKVKGKIERGEFFPAEKRPDSYLGEAPVLARNCPSVVRRLLTT